MKDYKTTEVIEKVLTKLGEFKAKDHAKVMFLKYGHDLHLAYERIEHSSYPNDQLPEDVVYLRLFSEESLLTEKNVKELVNYLNSWLDSKSKEKNISTQ